MNDKLVLLARYTPPGWGDPPPCCVTEHNWGPWRAHPNGVNDVRVCRNTYEANGERRTCSFSTYRDHEHWWLTEGKRRRCRMPGCQAISA